MFPIAQDISLVIIESTKDVFETMIFMDLEEYPEIDKEEDTLQGRITGIIYLNGKCSGRLMLHSDNSMASMITANLLGTDPEDPAVEKRMRDAIGEVSNMIAGNIKARLSEEEDIFDLSPPEVVIENNLPINAMRDSEGVIVPFLGEGNYLWVELILR